MKHLLRNVMIGLVTITWIGSPAKAQQAPSAGQDHDAHHREMMARGAQAMGFDQERAVHQFLLYADGGSIDVSVRETTDHATLHAIRQHLQEITTLFKAGDFDKTALTHAQQVPGTGEMTRLKDRITYRYEETPAGGRVRILTQDAEAARAIHAFLRFQIADHRTGDSGVVQPTASGRMMHAPGRGMMGMTHDAAEMAQMRDIHELFMNHDRITRTVTNLPNGIRTTTESTDPRIAQLLRDHVTGSDQRVAAGNDPELPIESAALRLIYKNHALIRTILEPTDAGIIVVQTSSDAETVAALQQHAAEVTEFVNNGMAAMHRAMMKNGGMRGRGMRPNPR